MKRIRCRAIIYMDGGIVTMYREKEGRIYYTFPGGGMEKGETEEECVVREVIEEFGMTIRPIKKVYVYENDISVEHFYICEHISGEFGSGTGEEYQPDRNKGVYRPTIMRMTDVSSLPLMPPEVAEVFVDDYNKHGKNLTDEIKYLQGKIK